MKKMLNRIGTRYLAISNNRFIAISSRIYWRRDSLWSCSRSYLVCKTWIDSVYPAPAIIVWANKCTRPSLNLKWKKKNIRPRRDALSSRLFFSLSLLSLLLSPQYKRARPGFSWQISFISSSLRFWQIYTHLLRLDCLFLWYTQSIRLYCGSSNGESN